MTTDQSPSDIKNYASVRDTPLVLAAVLIVFAVGTLAHVLLTGVRRRRRDLALLKTLGFTRSQVLATVAWQASTFASVALLIGLPLGVLAGRWAWAYFANAAGAPAQATVPLPAVLLAIPVTLLIANLIAAWPGWTAARLRPAARPADGVASPQRAANVLDVTSTTKECAGCPIDHVRVSAVGLGRRPRPFWIIRNVGWRLPGPAPLTWPGAARRGRRRAGSPGSSTAPAAT